jgi:hypothetical protein
MSRRRPTAALLAASVPALAGPAPHALAATNPKPKPKPIHQKYTVSDPTPNPVVEGRFGAYCRGGLPGDALGDEKGHAFKTVGKGILDVALSGVTGDWVLELRDSKGRTLDGEDVNPPDQESIYLVLPKAGTYSLWACNSNGGPSATVEFTFTYK